MGKKEDNAHTYCITDNGTKYDMTQINDMKDIGVIIDSDLKFEKHLTLLCISGFSDLKLVQQFAQTIYWE